LRQNKKNDEWREEDEVDLGEEVEGLGGKQSRRYCCRFFEGKFDFFNVF
jgi:hypothetical protein